ncbi:MAG: phospholipase D-like domain-containing protein [Bacteroidota bacterium]|nr:phospholipase D-like domain-containing protein [Bacteroidota bacterium]
MSNFITNSKTTNLKKRLLELIEKSKELKFLVGFFYFSGINELYEGLKKNPKAEFKILVGLNIDKTARGILEYGELDSTFSDDEKCYHFLEDIKKSINTDEFDNKGFYEQVKFFVSLIKNDKLLIRKTFNPNHSKLYLFKLGEDQIGRSNLFLTGSSNLTRAGLTFQNEFNVEISDHGFEEAEKFFDGFWDEAVKISEHDETKTKLIQTIENESLIKSITPYEAYVLLMKVYLDSYVQKEISDTMARVFTENGYVPYKYQLDAIKQALAIIENNNGVIIADVVGLGKSVIASAVAKELKKRGVVICPPGLIGDKNKKSGWNKYIEEFKLDNWEARSSGNLESLTEFLEVAKDVEVVIIDEAHRFRNQDTKDYELLKNICRDKIVILLTATPFNNRPGDILSLLKLFITPKKSTITLENNLVDSFKIYKGLYDRLGYIIKYQNSNDEKKRSKAETYYNSIFESKNIDLKRVKEKSQYLAKQIKDVIEPVTIRRNRLDLKFNPYYKDEVKNLSIIKDPLEWFFELTKTQSEFYDKIISSYFGDPDEGGLFKGAIYRPFEYEVEQKKIESEKLSEKENFQYVQQRNLFDFMRRLLVKRFESSFGSFEQSVRNFKTITENVLQFIDKSNNKFILDRKLLQKINELDDEDIEEQLKEYSERILKGDYPKNHKVYDINNFAYKDKFIKDINDDLKLYDIILNELSKLNLVKNDPKTNCLLDHLSEELNKKPAAGEPKRKIVIFSEYRDTVKYLEPILFEKFGKRILVITGDLSDSKISEINKNFDASYKEQIDDYDILLSTDRISEGFNLNRAGMVINYDIPWNPVRVIQRVGRINRISKKVFDELMIVNFFPTEKGAELVKSREIASNKMFLIHNTLGEDAKIFDIDEEPSPSNLFNRIQTNPDELEKESFYTRVLKIFEDIKKDNPELVEYLESFPVRIKVAKQYSVDELVFIKKGRLYIKQLNYSDEESNQINYSTFEEVFEKIKCAKDEKAIPLSDGFWISYEKVKNYKGQTKLPPKEKSLEQQALNNLKSLIQNPWSELIPRLNFIRALKEDIIDFGTLSDFTLRRISNLESGNESKEKNTVEEIDKLIKELGKDYLQKEKNKIKNLSKEIIIAVENQNIYD